MSAEIFNLLKCTVVYKNDDPEFKVHVWFWSVSVVSELLGEIDSSPWWILFTFLFTRHGDIILIRLALVTVLLGDRALWPPGCSGFPVSCSNHWHYDPFWAKLTLHNIICLLDIFQSMTLGRKVSKLWTQLTLTLSRRVTFSIPIPISPCVTCCIKLETRSSATWSLKVWTFFWYRSLIFIRPIFTLKR